MIVSHVKAPRLIFYIMICTGGRAG